MYKSKSTYHKNALQQILKHFCCWFLRRFTFPPSFLGTLLTPCLKGSTTFVQKLDFLPVKFGLNLNVNMLICYRHSTSYQVILKIVKNTCDNSVQKCVNINLYITMSISILSGRRMFDNLIIKICSKPSITQYKLKV